MSEENPTGCACQYCGQPAKLVKGAELYPKRPDLAERNFWECKPCGAYVGCHRKAAWMTIDGVKVISDGTLPLGVLANAELRKAKSSAHRTFDALWKGTERPKSARTMAYAWLTEKLELQTADCHIGSFTIAQCMLTIRMCCEHGSELTKLIETNFEPKGTQ